MSKSRGTFITRAPYLEHLDPEYLRYFYAASSARSTTSTSPRGLRRAGQRRPGRQVRQHREPLRRLHHPPFGGRLAAALPEPALCERVLARRRTPSPTRTSAATTRRAVREIMALADHANLYIDRAASPGCWRRTRRARPTCRRVCTQGLNLFRVLMIYLKPILPRLAAGGRERSSALPTSAGRDRGSRCSAHAISAYEPLATRVEPAAVKALLEAVDREPKPSQACQPRPRRPQAPRRWRRRAPPPARRARRQTVAAAADDRHRRLREGRPAHRRIVAAEPVEGADKLLKLRRSRRRAAHGLRRHPSGLRAGGTGRPAHRRGREPCAAQDALRRLRGHGARRRPGRRGHLPAVARTRAPRRA